LSGCPSLKLYSEQNETKFPSEFSDPKFSYIVLIFWYYFAFVNWRPDGKLSSGKPFFLNKDYIV